MFSITPIFKNASKARAKVHGFCLFSGMRRRGQECAGRTQDLNHICHRLVAWELHIGMPPRKVILVCCTRDGGVHHADCPRIAFPVTTVRTVHETNLQMGLMVDATAEARAPNHPPVPLVD